MIKSNFMKKFILLLLVFVSCTIELMAQVIPQQEHDALVALYNATDGDNWSDNSNWITGEDEGTWFGSKTDM